MSDSDDDDAGGGGGGAFSDRSTSLPAEVLDVPVNVAVQKEGWVSKRGGKDGQKDYKKRWFVLHTHALHYFKSQSWQKQRKPNGKVSKEHCCFAVSADEARVSRMRRDGDGANAFYVVTHSRTFRMQAGSAAERDTWVESINRSLVGCEDPMLNATLCLRRSVAALETMVAEAKGGVKAGVTKNANALVAMLRELEAEYKREHTVQHVLTTVEAAEAEGRETDIWVAKLTADAHNQATEQLTAIQQHHDVEELVLLCEDMGLVLHGHGELGEAARAYQEGYASAMATFKGQAHVGGEEGADMSVFASALIYEGPLVKTRGNTEGAKRQKAFVAVFEDRVAWWASKQKKDKSAPPDGVYSMRDILQVTNEMHRDFRITHFEEEQSAYFFTANDVETEKWIDIISHAIIAYNEVGPAIQRGYDAKKELLDGHILEMLSNFTADYPPQFEMLVLYLKDYTAQLFARLNAVRAQANEVRNHVSANNPHFSKRKVAAELDALVERMARMKAAIDVLPMLPNYLDQLRERQAAALAIMAICTPEVMERLGDIAEVIGDT